MTSRYQTAGRSSTAREYQAAQALTGTYLGTGAAFWVLVLAGLVDALWHARTTVEIRELTAPPKELPPVPTENLSPPSVAPALSLAF